MKARPDPRFLDDVARVAGGAINIISGMQQQMREDMRSRIDDWATGVDLVPRADLDRAEAMIAKLRQRLDAAEARLDRLEGKKTTRKAAKARPAGKPKRRKK